MNEGKYVFHVRYGFSLTHLAKGIEDILQNEGLQTVYSEPKWNAVIVSGTNVTGSSSKFFRNVSGTCRSISVYMEENDGELTVYFGNRAWNDKCYGFLLGIPFEVLLLTALYGTVRQLRVEDLVLNYIRSEVSDMENEVNLVSMNIKKRIVLATPLVSLMIFLTMGYVFNMWGYGALAFLLIPFMPMILGEISYDFIFPFVISIVYLGLGFGLNLWHPAWIMFLSIPVYYIIFPARHKAWKCCN